MPFLSVIVPGLVEILRRNVVGFWQGSRKAASMRVGSELKAARKKCGITVEVMSKRTKITVSKLAALEKNDFKNLPTGLYLFSAVRAYAREVRVDPEPIVERLRAEFADKDALDALHALDATGALDARNVAGGRKAKSNLLRNAAVAAGVLMATAGAGAFLHSTGRVAHEVAPTEALSVSLSAPASPIAVATAVDVPQPDAGAARKPEPNKPHTAKLRTAAVPEPQETEAIEVPSVDAPLPATTP